MRKNNLLLIVGIIFCLLGAVIIAYLAFRSGIEQGKELAEERQEQQPASDPSSPTYPTDPSSTLPPPTVQQGTGLALPTPSTTAPSMDLPPVEFGGDGQLGAVHGKGKGNLVAINSRYTNKNELVHSQVLNPLMRLIQKAEQDGVRLSIVSAYRSYDHQKSIWERKWGDSANDDIGKAKSILRLSSFPGTSRHHWGTDIDFNSVATSYWQSGEGQRAYQWLKNNAPNFGFCEVYGKGRSQGYDFEPWHWSYMPVANQYYAQITNPSVLNTALSQNIKGAAAARAASNQIMTHITALSACPSTAKGGGASPQPIAQQNSQPKAQIKPIDFNEPLPPKPKPNNIGRELAPVVGFDTPSQPIIHPHNPKPPLPPLEPLIERGQPNDSGYMKIEKTASPTQ